jgi:hypothetical protein
MRPLYHCFPSGTRSIPKVWSIPSCPSLQIAYNGDSIGDADGTPFDPGVTGNAGLRYDATTNQFNYNWNTSGLQQGCYNPLLTLDDNGPVHSTILKPRP